MSIANPLPWPSTSKVQSAETVFASFFETAPMGVARCNAVGEIVEMNAAFRRRLDPGMADRDALWLHDLVCPEEREKTDSLLRDLLDSRREVIEFAARIGRADHSGTTSKWKAWRQPGGAGEPDHALIMAEPGPGTVEPSGESLLQAERWEAIGRLTGGVAHDFNNLLTGVMLYCDLLLSTFDSLDRRQHYAQEIRSATLQATDLVQQLLVFARPQQVARGPLSLNETVQEMCNLLRRLIGENIALELNLDPDLGQVQIARSQAQQVILNLVLNARDALPAGGRIKIETSNGSFQPLAGISLKSFAFPCVLLSVEDNGPGMSAETRGRLFEPFFTTKENSKGGGLGLTTVRSIVTTNRGLIHFESEAGRGTRAMILLPRFIRSANSDSAVTGHDVPGIDVPNHDVPGGAVPAPSSISLQDATDVKKESL